MSSYEITFLHDGVSDKRVIAAENPTPDDRDIVLTLLKVLHPDEMAPFGLIRNKQHGEPADPQPRCIDVLAKYGISQVRYWVDDRDPRVIMS